MGQMPDSPDEYQECVSRAAEAAGILALGLRTMYDEDAIHGAGIALILVGASLTKWPIGQMPPESDAFDRLLAMIRDFTPEDDRHG